MGERNHSSPEHPSPLIWLQTASLCGNNRTRSQWSSHITISRLRSYTTTHWKGTNPEREQNMEFIKVIGLLASVSKMYPHKRLSHPRRDERAGRLQFGGWLIPEIGLSIMHVSVWFLPFSLRGALAHAATKKQAEEDTRGRQFVHICSLLKSFFFWILNFTVIGPPEVHTDQCEIIHTI